MRSKEEILGVSESFHAKMEEYRRSSNPSWKEKIALEMGKILLPLRGTRISFYQHSFERWYDMHQPSSTVFGAPVPTLEMLQDIEDVLSIIATSNEEEFSWATSQFGL